MSTIPNIPPQFLDNNGDPANGYQLFTYEAGTTTKVATYTDAALTTPNANPIILDSAGRATIFLSSALGNVKCVLAGPLDTDPPASPIWTRDNITPIPVNTISSTITRGSATVAAWVASGNVLGLTLPYSPTVISCIYDTPTDPINIPAGTLANNDDAIICEWEVDYSSATLSARMTAFGSNFDLGTGGASTVTHARYVIHRQTVDTVQIAQRVNQSAAVVVAQTSLGSLDLDSNAYTIELTMASGTFSIRGHRIIYVPALADWTL